MNIEIVESISFGSRVAEEDHELASYFIETNEWTALKTDKKDIFFGSKGSGKSALYSLLVTSAAEHIDPKTIIASAENPNGNTVFASMTAEPVPSEQEMTTLWKLYLSCVAYSKIKDTGIKSKKFKELEQLLENNNLIPKRFSLKNMLRKVKEYVTSLSLEVSAGFNPITMQPNISGKILHTEPSSKQADEGFVSADDVVNKVNVLLEEEEQKIWILIDRLDVAFTQSQELEEVALKALFNVYLDIKPLTRFKLKIFLRTDIWNRLNNSKKPFREASHITKTSTIKWTDETILNLIISRLVFSTTICNHFNVDKIEVLLDYEKQKALFYKIFPDKIDNGEKKPSTLDWIISRTSDGFKNPSPREVIHLLNECRDEQLNLLRNGLKPNENTIFSQRVFKTALKEVSSVKLNQTLYAEYPQVKPWIEELKSEKTEHSTKSLAKIWQIDESEATLRAERLVKLGFFEQKGTKSTPRYWIPFLYRDSLDLVQGKAEGV